MVLAHFPALSSGGNLGWVPPLTNNQDYWYASYGASGNFDQTGTTMEHFDTPTNYMWGLSIQRQLTPNWAITAEYLGVKGVHLLTNVWGWSLNNIPLQLLQSWNSPERPGSESIFRPIAELFRCAYSLAQPVAGPVSSIRWKQLDDAGPGNVGQDHSPTLPISKSSRADSMASNCWPLTRFGKPSQTRRAQTFICSAAPPERCRIRTTSMEGYAVATYEMPQTLKVNYSYDLPVGRGRMWALKSARCRTTDPRCRRGRMVAGRYLRVEPARHARSGAHGQRR